MSFFCHKDRTIKDFGDQWLRYSDNEGYYGSLELFSDILFPFLKPDDFRNCKVAEIGSGAGRIVNMLLESGVQHIVAVEPSDAFAVLVRNIQNYERVNCLKITGDQLPEYGDLDYVFSIGVLHHIPDPKPVVKAVYKALKPGGHHLIWLYGKEGNELYLALLTLTSFDKKVTSSPPFSTCLDDLFPNKFLCEIMPEVSSSSAWLYASCFR